MSVLAGGARDTEYGLYIRWSAERRAWHECMNIALRSDGMKNCPPSFEQKVLPVCSVMCGRSRSPDAQEYVPQNEWIWGTPSLGCLAMRMTDDSLLKDLAYIRKSTWSYTESWVQWWGAFYQSTILVQWFSASCKLYLDGEFVVNGARKANWREPYPWEGLWK